MPGKRKRLFKALAAVLLVALVAAVAAGLDFGMGADMNNRTEDGRVVAPDFPDYAGWVNTQKDWSMEDFHGRVVLLDFWTYCCINCIHVLPELKKLERKYPELVVVGVHSAKFTGERDLENIREAVIRYDIEHPVINDYRFELWKWYGLRAWPSFVLIDPLGGVVGKASGEGVYDLFDQQIAGLVEEYRERGKLASGRLEFELDKFREPRSLLSFPGKLEVDREGGRIFVSDSNNDRILVIDPQGTVLDVIGSGEQGSGDGQFDRAGFLRPQGMAWDPDKDVLYIADTENHLIRRADFGTREVETVLGTGEQGSDRDGGGRGRNQEINSPWDLALLDGGRRLIIAMAGPHQLWEMDTRTLRAGVFAGSGRENIVDGPVLEAQLAQPSGLSVHRGTVYFADSETSSIRKVEDCRVSTLVGEGLFDYGDRDGPLGDALLQHPLGVLYQPEGIYVADTYNNKIRLIDPAEGRVVTKAGTGESGREDGPARESGFNEPNDIKELGGLLYITDTNNGLIRIYDPAGETVRTLELRGLDRLAGSTGGAPGMPATRLDPRRVGPETERLLLRVSLPQGMVVNGEAPHFVEVSSSDTKVARPGDVIEGSTEGGFYEAWVPVSLSEGKADLTISLGVYYCESGDKSLCFLGQAVLELPLEVSPGAGNSLVVEHQV